MFSCAAIAASPARKHISLRSEFAGKACPRTAPPKASQPARASFGCEASAEASSSRRAFVGSSLAGLLAFGLLPATARAVDYRPDQLERLGRTVPEIRDILPGFEADIKDLMAQKEFRTARRRLRTFDRLVRMRLQNEVGNELAGEDKKRAGSAMDKLREHLFRLDERLKGEDEAGARSQLATLLTDIEAYLRLVPAAAGGSVLPSEL
eukprot:tig00000169_g11899.t1